MGVQGVRPTEVQRTVSRFGWGVIVGFVTAHGFWAIIFVAWWLMLIGRSGENVRQAIHDDFTAVRNSLKRAAQSSRN